MRDDFLNLIISGDVELTLERLNKKIKEDTRAYMNKEIVTVEMLETLVSSVLQRNLIKNAEVTITDKFFDKYFRGLDVLMVEVDNDDFDGTPLPPSFAVRLVYDTETLSKEFI